MNNILHQQQDGQGQFFLCDKHNHRVAELTYYFVDDKTINANHTYVSPTLRGQGVADKLYQVLRQFVLDNQLKLIPTCSYIALKWEREQHK
ncbi:MAG: GNAT family N-acetyltransferase [Pasteurellaceae bacterium]|nr:GNAT family N-acetyltransferase [Pasteurellaceae bacterium]